MLRLLYYQKKNQKIRILNVLPVTLQDQVLRFLSVYNQAQITYIQNNNK